MATSSRPCAAHRAFGLRAATVLVAGTLCTAVAGTAPATADQQFTAPVGQLPAEFTQGLGSGPDPLAAFGFGLRAPVLPRRLAVGPPAPSVPDLGRMITSAPGIASPVPAPAPVAPAAATPLPAPAVPAAPAVVGTAMGAMDGSQVPLAPEPSTA